MSNKIYIDLKGDPKIQLWIQTFSECQQNFNRDELKLILQHCFAATRSNQRLYHEFLKISQRSHTEFMVNIKKLLQYCLDRDCKHRLDELIFLESEYSLLINLLNQLHFRASIFIFCHIF